MTCGIYGKYADETESRTSTLSWSTVYNKMCTAGAFKKDRSKCINGMCRYITAEMWQRAEMRPAEIRNDDRSAQFIHTNSDGDEEVT